MDPVCCLAFNGRVPPHVIMDHRISTDQVQSCSASFERNEEDGDGQVFVEMFDHFQPVLARAVEIDETDPSVLKSSPHDLKHPGVLGKR